VRSGRTRGRLDRDADAVHSLVGADGEEGHGYLVGAVGTRPAGDAATVFDTAVRKLAAL
jgi:hypothetical protein